MKIKVALLSAGLGNVARGFEVSSEYWYEGIKNNPGIIARLFAGGKRKNTTKVWNLPRNGSITSLLRLLNFVKDGARLEQITFSVGFFFHLLLYRPDIIWLQEGTIGNILLSYRRVFGFKYRLMFCDGAPVGHEYAKRFDYIIFLHQYAMDSAANDGVDLNRCRVIPHLSFFPESRLEKQKSRAVLGIAPESFVVICVAAWNRHHKRIDYLLQEVAQLGPDKVTLLLCGQPEQESEALKVMAKQLAVDAHWYTLTQQELSQAYAAADVFVLPSLKEGLGAVLIEAGAHQLPIICHPHAGGKYILGESYPGFSDLAVTGNLAKMISSYRDCTSLQLLGFETEKVVRIKFNREKLIHDFVEFIKHVSQDSMQHMVITERL